MQSFGVSKINSNFYRNIKMKSTLIVEKKMKKEIKRLYAIK